MKQIIFYFLIIPLFSINSQTINLNENYISDYLRIGVLNNQLETNISFTIKPIDIGTNGLNFEKKIFDKENYAPTILNFFKSKGKIKLLPIDYNIEFNERHPYNRNNGSMIPNRGYQHIISFGFYSEIGPLSIQIKPEHLFSENKDFKGFGEGEIGHYPVIWARRYSAWNNIDMPERFGNKQHNELLIGQSNIKLNFKGLSLGISNENLWWGPSIRNSIMMSNHARGFKHITFNSSRPHKTKIGYFEWQLVSGRLESSGYTPPNTDMMYAGTKLYIPKINQNGSTDDWRYFQGLILSYSPKWIDGLTIGFIRWAQMYSALVEGTYTWMVGKPSYFPVFNNLFRKSDRYIDYEGQTDQAAGFFFKWLWKDSKAEFYGEFHHNDSKQNIRDFILDSDHSSAVTLGLHKIFKINSSDFLFNWEWTKMEQSAGRLLRSASSWYLHGYVYDGYTNRGEVIGSGIGPGSNSHYVSLSKLTDKEKMGIAIEIIDQDNDFNYEAFESSSDYRRYWKDINFHVNYTKKFKDFWVSSNLAYIRSLNYQWELSEDVSQYYVPGNDTNNFHLNLKLSYIFPLSN